MTETHRVLPWGRQPGESRQAFEAFQSYLHTEVRGTRSIRTSARRLGKSRQLLERWSARWRWGRRCELFDQARSQLRIARQFAAAEEEARQAAKTAALAEQVAVLGGVAKLDRLGRLMADEDFLLSAALELETDDLVGLVASEGEGALLLEGLVKTGEKPRRFRDGAATLGWAPGQADQPLATAQGGK